MMGVVGTVLVALPAGPAQAATPTVKNVVYATFTDSTGTHNLLLDVYEPAGSGPFPAVLVVHGAIRQGDKGDYGSEAQTLADNGLVAFAANYRMSCNKTNPPAGIDPALCGWNYPFPTTDLQTALTWIRQQGATYKADTTHIGAFGGSFGGALALTLGMQGTVGGTKADAVVSWSGTTELWLYYLGAKPTKAYADRKAYVGTKCDQSVTPPVCPASWTTASSITYVTSDDAPAYLANGTGEAIALQEPQDMDAALRSAGVTDFLRIIPAPLHSRKYEDYVIDSNGTTVFDESISFLQAHL